MCCVLWTTERGFSVRNATLARQRVLTGSHPMVHVQVSAFWPLQVFVAVGVAFLVFKDTLVPLQIIGGAIIILGLACVIQSARLTDRYERTAHGE